MPSRRLLPTRATGAKVPVNLAFPWSAGSTDSWHGLAAGEACHATASRRRREAVEPSRLRLCGAGLAGHLLQAPAHTQRVALDAGELLARHGAAIFLLLLLDVASGTDGHVALPLAVTRVLGDLIPRSPDDE